MTLIIILDLIFILFGNEKLKNEINFERIIFHTSTSFATCPAYHLQVDNTKDLNLFVEKVFNYPENLYSNEIDFAKIGYFLGKVNDITFSKLIDELNAVGMDTLKLTIQNVAIVQLSL